MPTEGFTYEPFQYGRRPYEREQVEDISIVDYNERGEPQGDGDLVGSIVKGRIKKEVKKRIKSGFKRGLKGAFPGAASQAVGAEISGIASSAAVTAPSALAPPSQLGSLPSIAEFAGGGQTAASGASAGISKLGMVGRGAGVIGGGVLAYQGIKKGNEEKGALGGAIAGFSVGGPVGAVIGAVIGGVGAAFNKQKSDLSDKFEDRLGAISRGDFNEANRAELNGLFEKQAESVANIDPELSQDIRNFRESINSEDKQEMATYGKLLLHSYLTHLESGSFDFDSDANQYAESVLGVIESSDPNSAKQYRDRLDDLLDR